LQQFWPGYLIAAHDLAMARFKPVWHGVTIPDYDRRAILDGDVPIVQDKSAAKKEAQSAGFTQVHVSGLPPDCEDDAVEAKIRQVLSDSCQRSEEIAAAAAAAAEAQRDTGAEDGDASAPPEASPTPSGPGAEDGDASSPPEASPTPSEPEWAIDSGEAPNDVGSNFRAALLTMTCSVVRNKDTLECKGYCFVGFETLLAAEEAVWILNEHGVEVAGGEVKAQLSQPKDAKIKQPKTKPEPELHDLRIRRQRYAAISKRAMYGHLTQSSGNDEGGTANLKRNQAGRISGVAGTRTGKLAEYEDSKCSSRSGFTA